jgi:hypothetical protein
MADLDISKLSLADIEAMMNAKKQEIEKTKTEKSAEALKFIEDTLKKKYNGLTLEDLGYAQKTEKKKRIFVKRQYKNPANGDLYTYKGFGGVKGTVKAWLYKDGKINPDLEVKTN